MRVVGRMGTLTIGRVEGGTEGCRDGLALFPRRSVGSGAVVVSIVAALPARPRRDAEAQVARRGSATLAESLGADLPPFEVEGAEEDGGDEGKEDAKDGVGGAVASGALSDEECAERRTDPGRDEPREGDSRSDEAAVREGGGICGKSFVRMVCARGEKLETDRQQ